MKHDPVIKTGITQKIHQTWLERLDRDKHYSLIDKTRDKHSSLLQTLANYEEKKFYKVDTRSDICRMLGLAEGSLVVIKTVAVVLLRVDAVDSQVG
jgi:hypothetical protein